MSATVHLMNGTHSLPSPLALGSEDSMTHWRAAAGAVPVVVGGVVASDVGLHWQRSPGTTSVWQTRLPADVSNTILAGEQLQAMSYNQEDPQRMWRARFPNADTVRVARISCESCETPSTPADYVSISGT